MQRSQCSGTVDPICCRLDTVNEIYDQDVSFSRIEASDKLEIGLIVSGSGIHQIMNQTVPCKENDIFLIPAQIPHGYFVNDNGSAFKLRRMLVDMESFFSDGTEIPGDPRFCFGVFRDDSVTAYAMLNSRTSAEVDQFFDRINDEVSEKKQEWTSAVRANLSLMFITLCRYVNSAIRNDQSFPPKEWRIVSSAIRAVTERFRESDLTLESIARSLYISKSQLSRVFKSITGEPFSDYLRRVRISHASNLLQNTQLTVEDIAAKCGLKDIPSFYRNFQTHTGMTPNQYRQSRCADSSETISRAVYAEISESIQRGNVSRVKSLLENALNDGCSASDALDSMLDGMNAVGERFKNNEVYVPDVLVAARAMNVGMQVIRPILVKDGIKPIGRACIGTVQGDLHDIGKNLVKMMMEGKGIEVIDLGTDVEPEVFVKTAIEQNCRIICCSALLTTTMGVMEEVVKKAAEAGIRDKVKIMIGGAPISESFCKDIGADVYTSDAASCADAAVKICREAKYKGENNV